jgi:hypothetical protein
MGADFVGNSCEMPKCGKPCRLPFTWLSIPASGQLLGSETLPHAFKSARVRSQEGPVAAELSVGAKLWSLESQTRKLTGTQWVPGHLGRSGKSRARVSAGNPSADGIGWVGNRRPGGSPQREAIPSRAADEGPVARGFYGWLDLARVQTLVPCLVTITVTDPITVVSCPH